MDCLEFLSRVLPPPSYGTYVGTYTRKKGGFWNEGFATLEELTQYSLNAASNNIDKAYFALGVFTDNYGPNKDGKDIWQRQAAQAVAFKTLAIDVDCGADKPYADQATGMSELIRFIKETGMPVPMVISSGNGLHCYWTLDKVILKAQWVQVSTGLKQLCQKHKFTIDWSKVHDASMVLRPVGTINSKGNHPVRLIKDAGPYELDILSAIIGKAANFVVAGSPPPKNTSAKATNALVDALLAGTEYPPVDSHKIEQNCPLIHKLTMNGGEGVPENQWHKVLGVASKCIDPAGTAIRWSKGHAAYTEQNTLHKMSRWDTVGPPLCTTLEKEFPGGCETCQFRTLVNTPVQLGIPKAEKLPPPSPEDTRPSPFADPPDPYVRSVSGVYAQANGVPLQVCDYDLFPTQIVRDPANLFDESIWAWDKPHVGYTNIRVRSSFIFTEKSDELVKHLTDNGVLLMNKQQRSAIGGYMRAYMQSLQKHQASTDLYDSFGWKDDYKAFVLGDTEFRKNDKGEVVGTQIGVSKTLTSKGLAQAIHTKGNADLWKTWTKTLSYPTMEGHAFALGSAFAAPLVALTGLTGSLLSLLGETGLGKSTMIEWINSVYGNHHLLGIGKGTQMAFAERMGLMAHMPVTIDEVTEMPPEQASDLAYWATQGRDKSRKTESVPRIWALPVIVTTNRSIREKSMFGGQAEAVSMRILEFTFTDNVLFSGPKEMGAKVRDVIWNNYGHAGRLYIMGLVGMGRDELVRQINLAALELERDFGVIFNSKERYWKMIVFLNHLGNSLARKMGIIMYDAAPATQWALDRLPIQRVQIANGLLDSYDLAAQYQNEYNGASLTIHYGVGGKPVAQAPMPRGEVRIRKELYINNSGKADRGFIYFDKFHFQKWLIMNGHDMKHVLEEYVADDAEFRPNRTNKIYMGKDSPMKLGQVKVVGLNLSHEKLRGMLEQEEDLSLLPSAVRSKVTQIR